ncbi:succinyl-diaminopimelate desuccinylase [Fimbriimonas ginsengisoli]|uniref:Succinyl-diaminopimelate desuccinylase n=1 Tax=Fimbriimonas ginsengisoli Gsoil 348 TaxID=661478 RepID=A0A068NTU7_FIMGI|nr:succinyl-diaminopimelate desuccinylase [Fimbriimonas ginsengisoli]AIE86787.1 succinyl-diaminopimelate desuccinylase [Fimbriimonas ginsengisoli Gsoil 348]
MSAVLELLRDLISRQSVTPNDAGCQAVVGARLSAAGFQVEHLHFEGVDNLWATHGAGAPLICLAGHTDVVPAGPIGAWTSEPFSPTERGGELVGRGAVDMKGSVAAMTVALEQLAAESHPGTIALLLTSDEEGPGIDGTRRVLDTLAERGVSIDDAIVGEPTSEQVFGDAIKAGRRGSMNGRLVVRGVQGHTAYPQLADNAAHRLAPVLGALVAADWGKGTADFPPTTFQVSNLVCGTGASNVIPGEAEVRFNVRFGTDWTAERIQDRIARIAQENGVEEPVEWNVSALPFVTRPGSLLAALVGAIESVTGIKPISSTGGGTSDARFFAAHKIPVAEFGPINATIHAANERIEIDCLDPLTEIYRLAVRNALRDR